MACGSGKKSCSLTEIISLAAVIISVFVIVLSVFSGKKQTLQERLKNVYDGLSPQDYE